MRAFGKDKSVNRESKSGVADRASRPAPLHRHQHVPRPLGNQTMARLLGGVSQRAARSIDSPGNRASGSPPPIVNEVLRSPGEALDSSTRRAMESRFAQDFSGVRIQTGGQASASADALNARAYTVGQQVVFGPGQYAPRTVAGQKLLAHELAHVVQQRGHTASIQAKPLRMSNPHDAAERRADAAAESVISGRAMPALGSTAPGTLHRAVKTFGGSFDTTEYVAINKGGAKSGVGKEIGANIHLKFTANDLVEADNIGLIQTVKTFRNKKAGGAVDVGDNARATTLPDALEKGEGDLGRGIDQLAYVHKTKIPQTNPLYATTDTKTVTSKNLLDVPAVAQWGAHGSHKKKADGTFDAPKDAELIDKPRREIAFAKEIFQQSFEVAALVLDGPMANTYLGSIAWGWETDDKGACTLNPASVQMVNAGVPSLGFRQASEKWNKLTFKGPKKKTFETVDLPVPSDLLESGLQDPANRPTNNLQAWLKMLNFQISVLDDDIKNSTSPDDTKQKQLDRTQKVFEKRAIEAELTKRHVPFDK